MHKKLKEFIANIENDRKRDDTKKLLKLMQEVSGYKPYLMGNIIGFGSYHYVYESGHEGDACVTGFSPRKQNLVVYVMPGFSDYEKIMEKLGKYKLGKSCLYLNKLDDIDVKVLGRLVKKSVQDMQKKYDCVENP